MDNKKIDTITEEDIASTLYLMSEDEVEKAGPGEEYDYEGYMIKTQLRRVKAQAEELVNSIRDDEQFPAWMQSKVTLASEYMDGVYDFYKYSDYTISSNIDKSLKKKEMMGEEESEEEYIPIYINEEINSTNMATVQKYWNLGPERASEDPEANKEYWSSMATAWMVPETTARRQVCANCEYFNNTPKALMAADVVPFNSFDADGGGRGYCHKFKFICHNLRSCLAWEEKEYEVPD